MVLRRDLSRGESEVVGGVSETSTRGNRCGTGWDMRLVHGRSDTPPDGPERTCPGWGNRLPESGYKGEEGRKSVNRKVKDTVRRGICVYLEDSRPGGWGWTKTWLPYLPQRPDTGPVCPVPF